MFESSNVKYKNLGGDSGVDTHTIEEESIEVTFKKGGTYLYTFQATGRQNVEQMKRLAHSGQGLNAFIKTHVKHKYAKKLR
jgi:hypothetical protein